MIQMVLLLPVVWLFLCDFGPELGMGKASFYIIELNVLSICLAFTRIQIL